LIVLVIVVPFLSQNGTQRPAYTKDRTLSPHLQRPWVGQRPAALLLPSLLTGAILLTTADMLVRTAPLVLPVSASPPLGVLTALLGAPFLVRIARRMTP
jgi:ABC-type Fe3+-siderophore transport system permease subunit